VSKPHSRPNESLAIVFVPVISEFLEQLSAFDYARVAASS